MLQRPSSYLSLFLFYLISACSIISLSNTQSSDTPVGFVLRGRRSEQPPNNMITFQCLSSTDGDPLAGATFFLNETDLSLIEEADDFSSILNDGLILNINRDLEGNYSCGFSIDSNNNVQRSVSKSFVAYPDPLIIPSSQRTFFAEVGSTAVLSCSISPGRLLQQYYVTWSNTSRGVTYREIRRSFLSSRPTTLPFDPRYTIDPVTFSLTISDVTLADSDPNYICMLGVEDAEDNQIGRVYERTEDTPLRLVVYKQPRITIGPTPLTVSLETTKQVRFNCTAVGQPAPKISWKYDGEETTSDSMFFTAQTDPMPSEVSSEEGLLVTTGTLVVFSLTEVDSVWVDCYAGVIASDETTGGQEVPKDTQGTRLSVLGGFLNINVIVTQDGDIIYLIALKASINTPVNLLFVYTNADANDDDDPVTSDLLTSSITTTISYNNTDMITHMEFKSRVPFPKFRVGVALMANFVTGPLKRIDAVYDVTQASIVSASVTKFRISLAAGIPIVVMAILLLFILFLLVISCARKCRKSHLKLKKQELYISFIETQLTNESLSSEIHERLLKLAENVIVSNCDQCEALSTRSVQQTSSSVSGTLKSTVVPDGGESGSRDADTTYLRPKAIHVHSTMLSASMTVMFKSAIKNPAIGPGLREEMMRLITESPYPLGDGGYSGSGSGSSCSGKDRESCV